MKVAFVVGIFPAVSETFVIDQIAALRDRGVEIEVFAFIRGETEHVSRKYFEYEMDSMTTYLEHPSAWGRRWLLAWPIAARLAVKNPKLLLRSMNVLRFGRDALSLRVLYWSAPFHEAQFDLVHCHFGVVGRNFVLVHEAARLDARLVTSLYGFDVSQVFRDEPSDYYDRLKAACSLYFVMSNDMRRRVIERGFPEDRVVVHPVSVDVGSYPFRLRQLGDSDALRLLAVGRLVEKKGFDDLLRALAIVRDRTKRPVTCEIIGGGELESELHELSASLGLEEIVNFRGYASVEQVIEAFTHAHVLVQPSKTAANGDME
jgi:colanic acid/amylovoran biosynthesis glycosyltransferase